MELGIIGLGKMGANIALNALDRGIKVLGKDVGPKPELSERGVMVVSDYGPFKTELSKPRVIYLSLPAGPLIDKAIAELSQHLDKGDIIMDGGNSYFRDSVRREAELYGRGIFFLDCGTSGGLEGARHGACFMVGGKREAYDIVEPLLKLLAVEGGLVRTGAPGSGHYAKLVHNGIEFGMLQSIGEGVALLQSGEYDLDLGAVFQNWANGSVIRGWLVELMAAGLRERKLDDVPDYVEDTGEVNWLIHESVEREVPVPVITQSVIELFRSRQKGSVSSKSIAMIRHGFGGHPFGKDAYTAKERKTSRIQRI